MTTLIDKIKTDIENWAEETWAVVKPEVVALGQTALSQIETAAETFVTTGGNFPEALATVIGALPADIKAGEAIVANVLSAMIVKAQSAAAAATTTAVSAAASTGTASTGS